MVEASTTSSLTTAKNGSPPQQQQQEGPPPLPVFPQHYEVYNAGCYDYTAACYEADMALMRRLCTQVEFYLSETNLADDVFLRQCLSSSSAGIPVWIICNLPKIRIICASSLYGVHFSSCNTLSKEAPPADPKLLCRALRSSQFVRVSADGLFFIPTIPTTTITEQTQSQKRQNPLLQYDKSPRTVTSTQLSYHTIDDSHREYNNDSGANNQCGVETPQQRDSLISVASTECSSAPLSPSLSSNTSEGVPTHPLPFTNSFPMTPSTADGNWQPERTTVVLRDLLASTTVSEVLEAFSGVSGEGCNESACDATAKPVPEPTAVQPGAGNTWYVSYRSEADAMAALAACKGRTIRGVEVLASLENIEWSGQLSLPPSIIPHPVQHHQQQYFVEDFSPTPPMTPVQAQNHVVQQGMAVPATYLQQQHYQHGMVAPPPPTPAHYQPFPQTHLSYGIAVVGPNVPQLPLNHIQQHHQHQGAFAFPDGHGLIQQQHKSEQPRVVATKKESLPVAERTSSFRDKSKRNSNNKGKESNGSDHKQQGQRKNNHRNGRRDYKYHQRSSSSTSGDQKNKQKQHPCRPETAKGAKTTGKH